MKMRKLILAWLVIPMLVIGLALPVLADDLNTSLLESALQGDLTKVQSLIGQGADVNLAGTDGRTPLINAAGSGNVELVKFLLERKALINVKTKTGETPFLVAAQKGYPEIMKLFMAKSIDAKEYLPALITAVKTDKREVAEVLAEKIELKYNFEDIICLAAKYGSNGILKLFAEKGADTSRMGFDPEAKEKTTNEWSPLMFAVENNRLETVKLLVSQQPERINDHDDNYKYPLMIASEKGNAEIVGFLLDNKAEANSLDKDNWTPMMYAAKNGRVDAVKMIIAKRPGLDLNRKSHRNETALSIAIANNQTKVVEVLKAAGAK